MNKKIIIGIGIFWLVIIIGFIGFKEYTLRSGQEIILKTEPVDPRDMFRGDYVILRYDISSLSLSLFEENGLSLKEGDKVYVVLDSQTKYAEVKHVTDTVPNEGLFMKATVISKSSSEVDLEYGIESYFVPEGEGSSIQNKVGRSLQAKVLVDKYGNTVLKGLIADGKDVTFG